MKLNIKSLAAVAAFATAAFTAQAQIAVPDLYAGFKSTNDPSNVVINLGTASSLVSLATGNGGTYTVGNFASQFTTVFGADWATATSGTTNWGVAGVQTGTTQDNPWVTSKWGTGAGTLGVQNSTAAVAKSGSTLNSASLNIQKGYAGYNLAGSVDLGGGAKSVTASNANSFASITTGTNAFGTWTNATFQNQTTNLNASVGASVSDLYYMLPSTAGQFVGTFALYQDGTLTFTVIPEPSTYAAILGVATLGFAAIRRRKQQIEAQV